MVVSAMVQTALTVLPGTAGWQGHHVWRCKRQWPLCASRWFRVNSSSTSTTRTRSDQEHRMNTFSTVSCKYDVAVRFVLKWSFDPNLTQRHRPSCNLCACAMCHGNTCHLSTNELTSGRVALTLPLRVMARLRPLAMWLWAATSRCSCRRTGLLSSSGSVPTVASSAPSLLLRSVTLLSTLFCLCLPLHIAACSHMLVVVSGELQLCKQHASMMLHFMSACC